MPSDEEELLELRRLLQEERGKTAKLRAVLKELVDRRRFVAQLVGMPEAAAGSDERYVRAQAILDETA